MPGQEQARARLAVLGTNCNHRLFAKINTSSVFTLNYQRLGAIYGLLMLMLYATTVFSGDSQLSADLVSLVDTEREFARTSVAQGIRSSFLEYFADDAIVFQPQPVKYKETTGDLPAQADPLAYTLDWQPLYSDVSAAGDLGYNTGPYILTDNSPARRPPQYGFFFSVWKKQTDGHWKVVLDVGIETNAAYSGPHELRTGAVSSTATTTIIDRVAARARLFELEHALQESAHTQGMAGAYSLRLSNNSRLHRNGIQPMLGRKAIVRYLSQNNDSPTWKPLYADIASSGDLGYVYGSYQFIQARSGAVSEQGYYARVWKRGTDNKWLVVLDTTSPVPSAK